MVAYGRLKDGEIKAGDEIFLIGSGVRTEVIEVGVFRPDLKPVEKLRAGEIGYIATGVKNISQCRVGDTIAHFKTKNINPLLIYQEPKPMVFTSFYPAKEADFERLKEGLNKLKLNDASLVFEPESSALGRGFKCGFLGLLHLEIISERLKREFNVNLVITTPSLSYQLFDRAGKEKIIYAAQQMPDANLISEMKEMWVRLEIVLPNQYLGPVMNLLKETEGIYKNTKYLTQERLIIEYEAPLREIIIDFYDRLKGLSAGYASMS